MPKIIQKQKVELTRWFKPGNYLALKELTLWNCIMRLFLGVKGMNAIRKRLSPWMLSGCCQV